MSSSQPDYKIPSSDFLSIYFPFCIPSVRLAKKVWDGDRYGDVLNLSFWPTENFCLPVESWFCCLLMT